MKKISLFFMSSILLCAKMYSMESSGSVYFIDKKELSDLIKSGEDDKDKSFRLYQYYKFSKLDEKKSKFWLKKSAFLGNSVAQYNYIQNLKENNKEKELKKLCDLWGGAAEIRNLCEKK